MRLFYEEHIGNDIMQLSSETAKHVTQVLRMVVGDNLVLTDGHGKKSTGEILNVTKRDCTVRILETEMLHNNNPTIALAIAFTKNNARMEWLLEKITEIGLKDIYPLQSSRSEKSSFKADRFHKKMISAMLQSQQYYLPCLHNPINYEEAIGLDFNKKFIAHCETDFPKEKIANLDTGNSIILIGPEGDFTTEEIRMAQQQNFKGVSLGKNRLRTETAGLVAVTLLHHLCEK